MLQHCVISDSKLIDIYFLGGLCKTTACEEPAALKEDGLYQKKLKLGSCWSLIAVTEQWAAGTLKFLLGTSTKEAMNLWVVHLLCY